MIANALPRPLTAGSVDNAILRADGTDGTILQTSGLIVEDAVVPYSVTGDAATDVITATGHIYTANQTVIFSAITGGAGLAANTVYFVRNPSGNTFQLSTTSGGAAINFTTNITAGSVIAIQANVAIAQNTNQTDSALVLTPKGTGALIAGPKPDGTATGGNARGTQSIDIQLSRTAATNVASGSNSIAIGSSCSATRPNSIAIGTSCSATNGGDTSTSWNSIAIGNGCSANGILGIAIGYNANANAQGATSIGQQANANFNYATAIGGQGNNSTATYATAVGGNNNNPFSTYSSCFGGLSNLAVGQYTSIIGGNGNRTNTDYSGILSSYQAATNRYGQQSHASGQFSSQGDAQRARFVMRNKTSTNSAVELYLDGSATRLTIPSGKAIGLTINICGISSTGAAVAHYMRQYALKNVAGTTTEVYAPITIGSDNAAGTSIALSASDANDALIVSVTGTASTIWRWVASVDAVEIAFGT